MKCQDFYEWLSFDKISGRYIGKSTTYGVDMILYLYVDFRVEAGIIRTTEFLRIFHHLFVALLWLEFLLRMCYTIPERWCSDG